MVLEVLANGDASVSLCSRKTGIESEMKTPFERGMLASDAAVDAMNLSHELGRS